MKRLLLGTILLALVLVFAIPMTARADVGISISLPPLILFAGPPVMVVIPETNVYVVPDVDGEIFFYNGWWWRPWDGRWYRSRNYRSGWVYYQSVPTFYRGIPPGWRNDYRNHRWQGHQWNYQRIPHQQVQQNWRTWEKGRHWEKQNTWGVQGLKPQTRSQQPSQSVKPKAQAKPQSREVQQQHSQQQPQKAKPQQARPQAREVQPQHSQPQPQKAKPQSREVQQQHSQPQQREAPPQSREEAKPQESRPQSREVQQQHSQPQHQDAPQQSKSRQGKPERGGDDKQDRK